MTICRNQGTDSLIEWIFGRLGKPMTIDNACEVLSSGKNLSADYNMEDTGSPSCRTHCSCVSL